MQKAILVSPQDGEHMTLAVPPDLPVIRVPVLHGAAVRVDPETHTLTAAITASVSLARLRQFTLRGHVAGPGGKVLVYREEPCP